MDDAEAAYRAAAKLIEEVAASGASELVIAGETFKSLEKMPSNLGTLSRLQKIVIRGTKTGDLSFLGDIENLQAVKLSDISVPIHFNPNRVLEISELAIEFCLQVDVYQLLFMPNLEELRIESTNLINASFISSLNVKSLSLIDCGLNSLELRNPNSLVLLDLSNNPVDDLEFLKSLHSLRSLTVDGVTANDFSPVSFLRRLEAFSAGLTNFSDLSLLSSEHRLTELFVPYCKISDISALKRHSQLEILFLDRCPASNYDTLSGLKKLRLLSLHDSAVKSLDFAASLPDLYYLRISKTSVTDLSPLAKLDELSSLDISDSRIKDLRPLQRIRHFQDRHLDAIVKFRDCAATADPAIREVSLIDSDRDRLVALLALLDDGWEPPVLDQDPDGAPETPPALPEPAPSPLRVTISDGVLRLAPRPSDDLPEDVAARARIAWQVIRETREDFLDSINVDNYRPLKSALNALGRALGASFDQMNEIGVGVSGQRLSELAGDPEFTASLPEGAAAELRALAATVKTFADRFPEWNKYQSDAADQRPAGRQVEENIEVFSKISDLLKHSDEVESAASEEYEAEVESASGKSDSMARALLASTRELLRTAAENLIIGLKLYGADVKNTAAGMRDFILNEAGKLGRVARDEARKLALYGILMVSLDLMKVPNLLSLAQRFPESFGWLTAVLRFLGLS